MRALLRHRRYSLRDMLLRDYPRRVPGLEAWYDASVDASVSSDLLRIDGSNRVSLIADRSGNSAANALCLNAALGNFASIPDSAATSPSTQLEVVARVRAVDWTPAATRRIVAKTSGVVQQGFDFRLLTTGSLDLSLSVDGTATTSISSSVAVPFTDLAAGWVKVTWRASDGRVQFFTAADNGSNVEPTFSQLGTDRTIAIAGIFNNTAATEIGAGNTGAQVWDGTIFRAIVRTAINGAAAIDTNFALAGKLVTSLTESSANAATVTINSSGDYGARVCGERDAVQLNAAKQPIYDPATRSILFDGSAQCLKSAAFNLPQPLTNCPVFQSVSWTDLDIIQDGNASFSTYIRQLTSTPNIAQGAGATPGTLVPVTLGQTVIAFSVHNGAASALQINRSAAVAGSNDTRAQNGVTIAARGDGISNPANIRFHEMPVFSAALDAVTRDGLALYAARKWRTSV